jgi:hypothetical protein
MAPLGCKTSSHPSHTRLVSDQVCGPLEVVVGDGHMRQWVVGRTIGTVAVGIGGAS